MSILLRLNDAFLCPGDEGGAHITDNPHLCPCGNGQLFSLAHMIERESNACSMVEVLHENFPAIMSGLPKISKLYKA